MDKKDILAEVSIICKQVFENQTLEITQYTTPKDVKNWDSLNHVMLISSIEQKFNIKFDLDDMLSFDSIGTICKNISEKI